MLRLGTARGYGHSHWVLKPDQGKPRERLARLFTSDERSIVTLIVAPSELAGTERKTTLAAQLVGKRPLKQVPQMRGVGPWGPVSPGSGRLPRDLL